MWFAIDFKCRVGEGGGVATLNLMHFGTLKDFFLRNILVKSGMFSLRKLRQIKVW